MQARKAINRYAACVAVGLAAFCALSADTPDGGCPVSVNLRGHENTEWSQSYAYHLVDGRKNLPRVLLVGDSIVNGYQGEARRLLEAKGVNVTYWISSYCVTSPHYLTFLGIYLDEAKYDVIHFNNGLHSLDRNANWSDMYHHKPHVRKMEGGLVAKAVLSAIGRK